MNNLTDFPKTVETSLDPRVPRSYCFVQESKPQ